MTAIIIIGIIIFAIYISSTKKKPTRQDTTYTNLYNKQKSEKEIRDKLLQDIRKRRFTVTSPNFSISNYDESIIDVTNQSYQLNSSSRLTQHSDRVPYWAHHYVYSYSELKDASIEQKKFYFFFKNKFLNGEYLDLEGNTNYAFILLFNLLDEYEHHKDIAKLEKQLQALGLNYPKTKSYCNSFLIKKMKEKGSNADTWILKEEEKYNYQSYDYDYDYWRLGKKYQTKLNLNDEQVKLLNRLWYPSNNFCSIEYCLLEVLKLYIALISELKSRYNQEETNIDSQFSEIADVIARKHFRYRAGSQNYKYCIENTTNELYLLIFKHCENAVREYYGHKRKLNTDTYYTSEEAKNELETKLISKVNELLSVLVSGVALPDEATEIELNAQNTNRWKIKFGKLTSDYNNQPKEFIDTIVSIGILNKKNPSVENIFFEASKFIAKHDRESALTLYVYYLYHDLKSASFDNKQFTKTIQKSLFKTDEQLRDFEKIVSELISDKDLDKALKSVPKIYEVKRKKIQLDRTAIKEVKQQHTGTVELLNEYLQDDFEGENNTIQSQEINNEEIKIEIIQKNEVFNHSAFLSELPFSFMHISTLELFSKNNFAILQSEFETFAKSKGVFKNQLIESINDICYEHLDDILIEEDDEYYTINQDYYQTIIAK
jgi:hypothetical protein